MNLKAFIDQASNETKVKYGPELDALRQLLSQAQGSYSSSRSNAAASQAGVQQAINQVRPVLTDVFKNAGLVDASARSNVSSDLAGLGPAADKFKAAASIEQGLAQTRLASALAGANSDLGDRFVRAADTANYQRDKALTDLRATQGQIGGRLQSLGGEMGAFAQGRVAGLTADQRKEAAALKLQGARLKATATQNKLGRDVTKRGQDITKRGQDITHKDAVAKAERARKAKADKAKKDKKPFMGPGSLTPEQESAQVSKVEQLSAIFSTPPTWPGGPLHGKPMTAEDVRHHQLANGANPHIVAAAYSLYKNKGAMGPDGAKNAHALGIHVNGRWKLVGGAAGNRVGAGSSNIPPSKV